MPFESCPRPVTHRSPAMPARPLLSCASAPATCVVIPHGSHRRAAPQEGLLGAGSSDRTRIGCGASFAELVRRVKCSESVLLLHALRHAPQIHGACLVRRHARTSSFFRDYLRTWRRMAPDCIGDLRDWCCSADLRRNRVYASNRNTAPFACESKRPSYGDETDDILLTARRVPNAAVSTGCYCLPDRASGVARAVELALAGSGEQSGRKSRAFI